MRELSLGEQDACRVKASQKIDSIVQDIKQKTSDAGERRGLLKAEFDRRAAESVRTLENFYPKECKERADMRDENMRACLIKCALTNIFVLETLRDKIACLSPERKSPEMQELRQRVEEEQQRFSVAYEVYKNEGVVTPETEMTLTERLRNLMVRTVPILGAV